jgi:DNA-binding HxlR family transcriptional regulator
MAPRIAESGYHPVTHCDGETAQDEGIPPRSECPMKECMKLIGSAWTADVIQYLREGERCFSELQTDLVAVAAKVLTSRSRRLELEGVLERVTRSTSRQQFGTRSHRLGRICAGL